MRNSSVNKILPVILFMTFLSPKLYAQDTSSIYNSAKKSLLETIEEKLKVDPADFDVFRNENQWNFAAAQDLKRGKEKKVIFTETPESEVHAVINPNDTNNILVCPIWYKNISGGYDLRLPVYYTKDFGNTWNVSSFQPRVSDTNMVVAGGGDPVFVFDDSGVVYLSWINLYYPKTGGKFNWGMFWAKSKDGGETWIFQDSIVALKTAPSYFQLTEIYDKQWMAADRSQSAWRGNIYIAYYKVNTTVNSKEIVLKRMTPSQTGFDSADVLVSNGSFTDVQFTSIGVDNYGYIHVTFYGNKNSLWHTVSVDGGQSFAPANRISNIHLPSGIPGIQTSRIYPCPHLVIDNNPGSVYNGFMYLTWSGDGLSAYEPNRSNIYFTRSIDNGVTWSTPIVVFDTSAGIHKDQFYPSISVNEDGVVVLTWYDARFSTTVSSNDRIKYFMAYSFDGGVTFTNNFPASTQFTDFGTVGLKNNSFGIGEYNQVLSTKGNAIAVFSDGRNANGNLDIYITMVNVSQNPDEIINSVNITANATVKKPFPNPTKGVFDLSVNLPVGSPYEISIIDLNGKKIQTIQKGIFTKENGSIHTDVSDLPEGNYFVRVKSGKIDQTRQLIILKQ